jgi:osmotically-inducible protein OsmY
VILQTAIRDKLEADKMTAGHVQLRVAGLLVVLTGDVSKKEASDRAEQIARNTRVTIDTDKPIVAETVKNLIKVGN